MPEPTSKFAAFVAELRRRRVFRVAAVYAGTTFVIIQIIDGTFAVMGIPDWISRLIIVLLLVGFPIAIGLAWAFDITDEGIVRTGKAADVPAPRAGGKPFTSNRALIVIAVLAVAFGVWSRWGGTGETAVSVSEPALGPKSIAVLPFANLSDSQEDEYFSAGVTDDIITHLTKIGDLKVISRTSAMLYKDSPKSLQVIADELGVANILEGTVRRHGNRVRITGQLIDARTDEHLWAETYDRELTDIFAIQSEVARNIAAALKAILSPEEKERIEQPPTASIEAYDLYLKGRSLFYTYEKSKNEEAIVMFRKAIDLDPSFSLGYAGLSLCYSQYRNSGWDDDEKWIVLAENAAKKAIALDSYSAEAHFALGFVYERRGAYDEMEREMRKVIELNQNHAHAHNSMGDVAHRVRGQLEDAVREYRLSLMIDPFLLPSYWQNAEVEI
ncbi:MAG: hypothetical protein IIB43_10500, partial [Candidatus Marinimicrobia bacterium]|nr:hypothetical protein [Candidatus Neomarinimicrobiota bacterium]